MKLGAQSIEKTVLNIEHLYLYFNKFFLFDVFDLTEVPYPCMLYQLC